MPQFRPLSETKFINDANLVSYWKLDGNSNDSKGSNNGTDTNISYVAGKFSNCASFNGSSSKIQTSGAINLSNNFTLSLLVNPTTLKDFGCVLNFDPTTDFAATINTYADGHIFYGVGNNSSSWGNSVTTSAGVLTNGTWCHIIGTGDGTNIKLYLNGKFIGSAANTSSINDIIQIGTTTADGKNYFFNGLIDDTAIFSRALSSSEINELYQGMTLGEYLPNSNTKLLLHLNGNSTDSSGNNNNGIDTAITYSQANGKFGMGAGFNGATSYIDLGAPAIGNTFTISLWFKRGTPSGEDMLATRWGSVSANGRWGIGFVAGSTTLQSNIGSDDTWRNIAVTDTNWNNVVLTYTGTTEKCYYNGNLVLTQTTTYAEEVKTINLGRFNSNAGYYVGAEDEFIHENFAWTPQQVAKYYANAKGYYATL